MENEKNVCESKRFSIFLYFPKNAENEASRVIFRAWTILVYIEVHELDKPEKLL